MRCPIGLACLLIPQCNAGLHVAGCPLINPLPAGVCLTAATTAAAGRDRSRGSSKAAMAKEEIPDVEMGIEEEQQDDGGFIKFFDSGDG